MPPLVGMTIAFMCAVACGIRVTKVIDKGKKGRIIAWAGCTLFFAIIEIIYYTKVTS